MQQRPQGQRGRGPIEVFEQEQRVHPHVALGVVLRRLLHALHGGHLGKKVCEHPGGVQQLEAPPRAALGQDADQFVAHPLGGDSENERMVAADGLQRGG